MAETRGKFFEILTNSQRDMLEPGKPAYEAVLAIVKKEKLKERLYRYQNALPSQADSDTQLLSQHDLVDLFVWALIDPTSRKDLSENFPGSQSFWAEARIPSTPLLPMWIPAFAEFLRSLKFADKRCPAATQLDALHWGVVHSEDSRTSWHASSHAVALVLLRARRDYVSLITSRIEKTDIAENAKSEVLHADADDLEMKQFGLAYAHTALLLAVLDATDAADRVRGMLEAVASNQTGVAYGDAGCEKAWSVRDCLLFAVADIPCIWALALSLAGLTERCWRHFENPDWGWIVFSTPYFV